jgi:ubiquinone/menaquinone biosynthesis C-methylase UbiE
MKEDKKHRVCPVAKAGMLDFALRRWLQNPEKILRPFVKEGMTALDLGCGPGFFTLPMARLVGKTGKVIAADLQQGMLALVGKKIENSDLAAIVKLHQSRPEGIGLAEKCDFILIFYMLHEVPDPAGFLGEIRSLLKPEGRVLIVEPKWHVTQNDFQGSIGLMMRAGFAVLAEPAIRFSRTVVLCPANAAQPGNRPQAV